MNTDKIYAEQIANEYAPKSTSKIIALRKLDRRAKRPALISAYTIGIVFTLIFGLGMCLAMGVIGSAELSSSVIGIIVGCIGMAGIAVNYPIYKIILARGKSKYAFEIIQLAREVSGEE